MIVLFALGEWIQWTVNQSECEWAAVNLNPVCLCTYLGVFKLYLGEKKKSFPANFFRNSFPFLKFTFSIRSNSANFFKFNISSCSWVNREVLYSLYICRKLSEVFVMNVALCCQCLLHSLLPAVWSSQNQDRLSCWNVGPAFPQTWSGVAEMTWSWPFLQECPILARVWKGLKTATTW